jgi:phosphoserine phosphatase
MGFFITLVASDTPLTDAHVRQAAEFLNAAEKPVWLGAGKAADIFLPHQPPKNQMDELRALLAEDKIDVLATPAANRRKKLLMADMDSTIVREETLDELAAYAGIKDRIAAITEKSMRGELDFKAALRERVALLKGLKEEALTLTLEKTQMMPGAIILARTMARHGATCVLVSGGFTFFTAAVAARVGFHHHHGNTLEIDNGALTGKVTPPILDKDAKSAFLQSYSHDMGIGAEDVIALGDGANDLPMLQAAGLGIGFHPKPLLCKALDNVILHADLTAALYAQGYKAAEFTTY